ncbi:hypothetical protein CPLU01_05461 [Colletotrichum plurivorum]|uniref:Uncharacterized protein n=1 Tax=Colletotrichum plurivorum TaxID=2175906 RepID=A0A8H6NI87_9PEZI|nr:hypothetical protein CPLU01_05461 [Colletotrichum plurivorum]
MQKDIRVRHDVDNEERNGPIACCTACARASERVCVWQRHTASSMAFSQAPAESQFTTTNCPSGRFWKARNPSNDTALPPLRLWTTVPSIHSVAASERDEQVPDSGNSTPCPLWKTSRPDHLKPDASLSLYSEASRSSSGCCDAGAFRPTAGTAIAAWDPTAWHCWVALCSEKMLSSSVLFLGTGNEKEEDARRRQGYRRAICSPLPPIGDARIPASLHKPVGSHPRSDAHFHLRSPRRLCGLPHASNPPPTSKTTWAGGSLPHNPLRTASDIASRGGSRNKHALARPNLTWPTLPTDPASIPTSRQTTWRYGSLGAVQQHKQARLGCLSCMATRREDGRWTAPPNRTESDLKPSSANANANANSPWTTP